MPDEISEVAVETAPPIETDQPGWKSGRAILLGIIPLLLLIAVLGLIFATDGGLGDRKSPPIETLSVQTIKLPEPGMIEMSVVNDGPDDITIAQVLVDDAFWDFDMSPGNTISRLESATIEIPYPWVENEAHAITLISSTGVLFDAEVPVAIQSPERNSEEILRLGLIGFYVGVVPIVLGMLWFPFMKRLGRSAMNFILALTIGLLAFLVFDMWGEAQEIAIEAPTSLKPDLLIPILAILTAGLLIVVGQSLRDRAQARGSDTSELTVAYQLAIGIGLHNLGEGLAIGSAFAIGEVALGVFLIAGFTLHNVTEGIGIAAPLVRNRPSLWHFVALAVIAGGPAMIGTWIGAFTFSPFWTTVFLAIGIGAIAQVIYEVARLIRRSERQHQEPAMNWVTLGGLAAGFAVMYLTALLVSA